MNFKDLVVSVAPSLLILLAAVFISYKFLAPAPPHHLVMATGEVDGDYQYFGKQYQTFFKKYGIDLELRPTEGPLENLKQLEDDDSDVDVGFSQDGIGSQTDQPDVTSLGSLNYEPIWLFYRGSKTLTRFSQLQGKKIALGRLGHETRILAQELLNDCGVNKDNTQFADIGLADAAQALKTGKVDAAFFMLQPEEDLIEDLLKTPNLHLMSFDQAEAFTRINSSFHHLVLPHGAIDLKNNLPAVDVDMLATTTTLLVSSDIHPALSYLLLKAAQEIHGGSGIFEDKNEFPMDKDDQFPMASEAKQFYANGGPFWQRFLPFWMAVWINRFLVLIIPLIAVAIPIFKFVPQFYHWRLKKRIYKLYGELRYLETQIKNHSKKESLREEIKKLDSIEEKINRMKFPLGYVEHTYSLRGHIDFVRARLRNPEG